MASFCGKCGSPLDPASSFCSNCGAPVPGGSPNAPAAQPGPESPVWGTAPAQPGPAIPDPGTAPVQVGPAGDPPAPKKRGPKPWVIALAVAAVLLTAVICLGVLTYFEVIEIPGVSDLMADLRGDDEEEEEDRKKEDTEEGKADGTTADAPETEAATEEATESMVVPVTLSGVLTRETYQRIDGTTGEIFILTLDKAMTFTPYPPFDAQYRDPVKTSRVQLLGGAFGLHTDKHVTVHGELTFATQDEHRETVLLQNCNVEITPNDEAYNRDHGLSDPTVPGTEVTVRLDESAGSGKTLNIRSGPGYSYDVVATVQNGATLTMYEEENGWARVDYGRGFGWCNIDVAGFYRAPSPAAAPGRIVDVSCSRHSGNGANGRVFTPEMAIDGNPDTCWMAAGGEGGSGNWIQFDFGGEKTLYGIQFLNGNLWDDRVNESDPPSDLYHINGRIKDFTLTFSDGSTKKFTAADVKELELSEYGENLFMFDSPVQTSFVRITVDSGYPGYKWDTVVCLAEFAAYFD